MTMKKTLIPLILTILIFSSFKSFASGLTLNLSSIEQQEESVEKGNDLEIGYNYFSTLKISKKLHQNINYQNQIKPSELIISLTTPPPNFS